MGVFHLFFYFVISTLSILSYLNQITKTGGKNMQTIPKKIKTDMLFNKLFLIIAGVVGCGALFGIQQFLINSAEFKFNEETLTLAFIACYVLMAVFLIAYPTLLLILGVDSKRIIKDMKRLFDNVNIVICQYIICTKHFMLFQNFLPHLCKNFICCGSWNGNAQSVHLCFK